jgi:hypothetical protein
MSVECGNIYPFDIFYPWRVSDCRSVLFGVIYSTAAKMDQIRVEIVYLRITDIPYMYRRIVIDVIHFEIF